MPGTYKKIEIVGTSNVGFSEAVQSAITEASQTVKHMDWFEIVEQRGNIKGDKVAEYQVVLKVGFKIEH
jgi:dodecin